MPILKRGHLIFGIGLWTLTMQLLSSPGAGGYCLSTNSSCWPTQAEWCSLAASLDGKLEKVESSEEYNPCYGPKSDAREISAVEPGICMQTHDCSRAFCNENLGFNLPSFVAMVQSVSDVQKVVNFAREKEIVVSVKTTGHSYQGSSTRKHSVQINLRDFPKIDQVFTSWEDSCSESFSNILKIGGGETWEDAYKAAFGAGFHIVGGGGLSVSAAGGWLQGCGLSSTSRKYGMGVDNVRRFEVVLADGSAVFADSCTNTDLFWALRGGGGGTFGVVTAAYYQLHSLGPIVFLAAFPNTFSLAATNRTTQVSDSFIDLWIDNAPNLPPEWGGYWTIDSLILYFVGTLEEANAGFGGVVKAWQQSLVSLDDAVIQIEEFPSYWIQRGEGESTDETGSTNLPIGNRLISLDFVKQNPTRMKNIIKEIRDNQFRAVV
mmetsp:Transcript_31786/g.49730  ORF Transcript_31786/g.49730 Transcript_31786/m.49730 type:complete len:433 (-) Transcript_31786:905-2203(-)